MGSILKEDLEKLITQNLSQREIGAKLNISQTTVRYWLERFNLKTNPSKRKEVNGEIYSECKSHGETKFFLQKRGGYRCAKCRSEKITSERRALKKKLVEEAGGKCVSCGYDKCIRALEFHHIDPQLKERSISLIIRDRNYKLASSEIKKCILLCSNCHAEVEESKYT